MIDTTKEMNLICGDYKDKIKDIPDKSIDAIITDAPYLIAKNNSNFHTMGKRAGTVAMQFGDWDTVEEQGSIEELLEPLFKECPRILKENANVLVFNCWQNLGKIADMMINNHIIPKRNFTIAKCLSNTTELIIKNELETVKRISIKDLLRSQRNTDYSKYKLWDGEEWVNIYNIVKNDKVEDYIEITVRDGNVIRCTKDHKFFINGKEIEAKDLKVGDILDSAKIEISENIKPYVITKEIAQFIGLFIADGSYSGTVTENEKKVIQISEDKRNTKTFDLLSEVAKQVGCKLNYTKEENGNRISYRFHSSILLGILEEYVAGKLAYGKHFSIKCFSLDKEILKEMLYGYLEYGDGGHIKNDKGEIRTDLYKLGFTNKNIELAKDLRQIANILGYGIYLFQERQINIRGNFKRYGAIIGEIYLGDQSKRQHAKQTYEIQKIRTMKNSKEVPFYDIQLNNKKHRFCLYDGILTHNCNPAPFNMNVMPVNDTEHCIFAVFNSKDKPTKWTFNNKKEMIKCLMMSKVQANDLHPTQKDPAIIIKLTELFSNKGDVILDPFMGSGTQGIACKYTGRKFIGIEKDETYFKRAKDRIEYGIEKVAKEIEQDEEIKQPTLFDYLGGG